MKVLIVGHGEYGTGIKSVIKLLTGVNENIDAINLNEDLSHDKYTELVSEYVRQNDELIIFADITGGAPYQIAATQILTNETSDNQYVVGGVSVGCILDIIMKLMVLNDEDEDVDVRNSIGESLEGLSDMASIICRKDLA